MKHHPCLRHVLPNRSGSPLLCLVVSFLTAGGLLTSVGLFQDAPRNLHTDWFGRQATACLSIT